MKRLIIAGALLVLSCSLFAKYPGDSTEAIADILRRMDSIESSLHYKTGKIMLQGGTISVNVPAGFKFLESAEAKYVVEDLWGNPPDGTAPLGLLMPANASPLTGESYAFIVTYDNLGYVKDDDASDINYDDLLKEIKETNIKSNEERAKQQLSTMNIVGWAARPYYDKDKKVLHWAKEYSVTGETDHTLNYDVRILGRKGVLTLQAVAPMDQLDSVNAHINDVLAMVAFTDGNRYSDFDSGTDDVAAWTIGGLVAGKILAKVGFFAVILKFFKFIILGLAVAGVAIWRFITGRRKKRAEDEYVYEPATVPHNTDTEIPKV